MSPHLPKELILEIISRLPPRNAMQLCCMSKEWRSALSSSQFRSLHLDNFTRNTRSTKTFFWRSRQDGGSDAFFIVRNDDPTCSLTCPSQCSSKYTVVGIINGVVCLAGKDFRTGKIIFWNPVIKRKISLLQSANAPPQSHSLSLGFAYDEERNEHKLFRAYNIRGYPSLGLVSFQVFSLTTGQWMDMPGSTNFNYCIANSFPAAFFKGFCHWPVIGRRGPDYGAKPYILRVHASDYIYSGISLPNEGIPLRMIRSTRVVLIEGSLALIPCPSRSLPVNDSCMVVWFMRVYGDAFTWTKRYRIAGVVSSFADEAILFAYEIVFRPTNPTQMGARVKLFHAGFFIQDYSESLELLSQGELCTCFCPP